MRRTFIIYVVLCWTLASGCGRREGGDGSGAATRPSPVTIQSAGPAGANRQASAVTFPPRNEPFDFRVQLEGKYRDQLRRPAGPTYVDNEGDIVWTQEYLRYRVNACSHDQAMQRVFSQIDSGFIAPECGSAASGAVLFPPRNEPFDFRVQLEAKYRDQLRRGAVLSSVDIEGSIVWTQEYLRYRLNYCNHSEGVQKVFQQIDTGVIQPVCGAPPPPPPPAATLVARPGGPYGPVNAGTTITLNGLASTSTPSPIAHYYWTCGQTGNANCTRDSPTAAFVYVKQGSLGTITTYTATLIIEDTAGRRSAPATATVRITNVYGGL